MATQAQIEANRRNARNSSGPRTAEGKTTSRKNATRHNLCMDIALQSDEDSEQFHILLADLREEHQPQGPTEDILVFKMAEHFWFSWRSSILLAEQLDFNDGEDNKGQISLMLRYHTTADRGFIRSLNELRKLQKERRLEEIGFVSQNAEPGPEASPETPAQAAPVVANDAKIVVDRPVPAAETRLRPATGPRPASAGGTGGAEAP